MKNQTGKQAATKSTRAATATKSVTATKKTSTTKLAPASKKATTKEATAKKVEDPLAMCPVDGAGWCPYPFSVAQLKKRLKARQST